MLTVIIVRHGETDHNKNNILQGHLDVPLNNTGLCQATKLGAWMKDKYRFDQIYSSPLERAYSTAEAIQQEQACELSTLPELKEIDVGQWQGFTAEQCQAANPDTYQQLREDSLYTRRPGGESYWDLYQRTSACLETLAAKHRQGMICLVTHGGCVRTLLAYALSAPPDTFSFASGLTVDNTGVSVLHYRHEPRRWQIRTVNATCHLDSSC